MAENKQPLKGFIGGSYRDNNPQYDCQEAFNVYAQVDESVAGKQGQISELLQRPGLKFLQNLGLNIRPGGMWTLQSGNASIIVAGDQVFQIEAGNGFPTPIAGNLTTSSGFVSISDNGGYVVIVDGSTSYATFQVGTTTLTVTTDPHYYGATQVVYQDGFWVFNQPNTPNIFFSQNAAPQGGTGGGPLVFGDSNIAVKQGYADNVVGICSNARELFIEGSQTGEVWFDAGTSPVQPFVREDGKNTQVGCISAATFIQLAGTTFWLGQNPQGGAIVYYMNGYTPTRISTHAVEQQLNSLGDLSESYAFGIQYQGHYFYVLQAQGGAFTWVFDVSGMSEVNPQTGLWCKWTSTLASNLQGQFLGVAHCYLNGTHLIGDVTGNIFAFDSATATDNGLMLERTRQSPILAKNLNNLFVSLLQVDFLMGQGLVNDGVNTANSVSPRAVLRVSRDGGETFGPPLYAPLGKIGKYRTRARWDMLGDSRNMVFRVTVTDPVIAHMILAEIDYEPGYA